MLTNFSLSNKIPTKILIKGNEKLAIMNSLLLYLKFHQFNYDNTILF